MRTGPRIIRSKAIGLRTAIIAGSLGLAALAASSAATPADPMMAPAAREFAATFAAFETMPLSDPALPAEAVDVATLDIADETGAERIGGGTASYYAGKFHGRRTASGERFDNGAMTAAHRTLPFGSRVRVINPANGRSVTVRINDRGPFTRGRVIDVSRAAAEELGMVARGHARVELELVGR